MSSLIHRSNKNVKIPIFLFENRVKSSVMLSKLFIVTLGTLSLLANGKPTGGPTSSGRDTSKDYYLKSRTVNASSPMNNLYCAPSSSPLSQTVLCIFLIEFANMIFLSSVGLGDGNGFAFWGEHTAFNIAFRPTIGNTTAKAYMNGTHQAFDVGKAGVPGSTYSLGSSYFQGPDPSVPSTANIFQDGTPEQDPLDVSLKNNALLRGEDSKWLSKSPGIRVILLRPAWSVPVERLMIGILITQSAISTIFLQQRRPLLKFQILGLIITKYVTLPIWFKCPLRSKKARRPTFATQLNSRTMNYHFL